MPLPKLSTRVNNCPNRNILPLSYNILALSLHPRMFPGKLELVGFKPTTCLQGSGATCEPVGMTCSP